MLFGLVLAGLCHIVLLVSFPERSPVDLPRSVIGYEGPIQVMEITPVDPTDAQDELARTRRKSGALVAITTEVDSEVERTERKPEPKVESPAPALLVFEAPPPIIAADEPVIIELREDFTVAATSQAAALSDKIRTLHVVRPEYPRMAVEDDIEGLVRLEAEVGISGRVLAINVLETPDSRLTMAAYRALLLWEFQPLLLGDQPKAFRVVVPFRFSIIG